MFLVSFKCLSCRLGYLKLVQNSRSYFQFFLKFLKNFVSENFFFNFSKLFESFLILSKFFQNILKILNEIFAKTFQDSELKIPKVLKKRRRGFSFELKTCKKALSAIYLHYIRFNPVILNVSCNFLQFLQNYHSPYIFTSTAQNSSKIFQEFSGYLLK